MLTMDILRLRYYLESVRTVTLINLFIPLILINTRLDKSRIDNEHPRLHVICNGLPFAGRGTTLSD